jgi:hypothetical protein
MSSRLVTGKYFEGKSCDQLQGLRDPRMAFGTSDPLIYGIIFLPKVKHRLIDYTASDSTNKGSPSTPPLKLQNPHYVHNYQTFACFTLRCQFHVLAALFPVKRTPIAQWIGGCVGKRTRVGDLVKKNTFFPCRESKSTSFVTRSVNWSLYEVNYPNCVWIVTSMFRRNMPPPSSRANN